MATQEDVRRIALSLPGAEEADDRFAFHVVVKDKLKDKPKGFAWVWLERIDPKKARIPNPRFLAVRTTSVAERDLMIAAEPGIFFTEPHYNGYPAVLVRLEEIPLAQLEVIMLEGWRHIAPRDLAALVD
ncbi:MAG TPA: hypothetical protein VGE27_04675 [Gemmatimonas sp.]|uniref:MmcQ/YjbR family DNA-binding protein n=1 Tax=Gemmatimonas sp. TaxID=1962908 RepID=UPI002ED99473